MSPLVPIVLFGWIPLVLALFAAMPARRAVITAYIAGVLFLPCTGYKLQGIPDYSRATATSFLVMLGVVLFDSGRLMRFRPSLLDLPMAAFCGAPLLSAVSNGLGVYDGLAAMVHQMILWGIPYLMGRLYLGDVAGHRELAIGMLIGAMVYIPLCLLEVRMSPQLHNWVYGFHAHQFVQTIRLGGYRPVVFMEHGLAVGLWMGAASVIGVWLWHTGALTRVLNLPMQFVVPALLATFVLCKSSGALVLFILACGALFAAKWLRVRVLLLAMAAIPLVYIGDRVAGTGLMRRMIDMTAAVSPDRASSLQTRYSNEVVLVQKAMERPMLGWAGWGGSRVTDEEGHDTSTTDGLWVITLGCDGMIGLAGLLGWQLLPAVAVIRKIRRGALGSVEAAAPLALAVVMLMMAIDCLPNAPSAPVYLMISGGLTALSAALRRPAPVAQPDRVPLSLRPMRPTAPAIP